jgi:hypothetical protein
MSAIINSGGGGGGSFTTLTGGINTGNSFVVGNGSSITTTGTGSIQATPLFPVNSQTGTSYNVTASDFAAAKLITMNNAAGMTLTLLASAPPAGQAIFVQNISPVAVSGSNAVTIVRNGLTIDGVAGNPILLSNAGVMIVSDGSNYFTERGTAGQFVGAVNGTGGQQYQLYQNAGGTGSILVIGNTNATNYATRTLSFGNAVDTFYLSSAGDAVVNTVGSIEATAPAGLAGTDKQFADSVTHTWGHNSNNNGTMSFSGAWVNTNLTPVTVNANVSTDQSLMTVSVPAGTLNRVGRSLRFYGTGVYSTPAASTSVITVKVKLGALTLITWTTTALGTVTAANNQFNISGMLSVQTAGASGAFEPHGLLTIDLGAGNLVADTTFADVNTATVGTVDITAAQNLLVTIAFSNASGSNSTTQRQMILETVG